MNKKSNTSITICEATSATAKQGVEQRGIAVVAAGMLASVATLILVAVTDFIITMTLSAADASAHITHSTESPRGYYLSPSLCSRLSRQYFIGVFLRDRSIHPASKCISAAQLFPRDHPTYPRRSSACGRPCRRVRLVLHRTPIYRKQLQYHLRHRYCRHPVVRRRLRHDGAPQPHPQIPSHAMDELLPIS